MTKKTKNFLSSIVDSPEKLVFTQLPTDPEFGRNMVMVACERLGGMERLLEWIADNPKNEYAFWTKMFSKLIENPKAVQSEKEKTIAEILRELDENTIDVTPDKEPEEGKPE